MPYRAHVAPLTPHLRLISTSRTVDLAGANEDSSGHAEFFHANRAWRKTVESDGTEGEDFHEHLRRWRRRQRSRRPQRATAQQKRERWRTPAERAARGSLRSGKRPYECLETNAPPHNPSNRAVGWSACARKLFFSYKSVKTRPHMRLTDMIAKAYVISTWSMSVESDRAVPSLENRFHVDFFSRVFRMRLLVACIH